MDLLKTPLELDCPYCEAKAGEECFYIYDEDGSKWTTAPHVRREEAMANENKRRIQEHIYARENR
jgi:hypothetical protein